MSVVVAIATYCRPSELARCLQRVGALKDTTPEWRRHVIVVDNDPQASGREAAFTAADAAELDLTYEVEPRPGISAARNRCLALAAGFERVAFIDDDEWPDPRWLRELLEGARATGSDLTGGPVVSVFEHEPPRWAMESGVFVRAVRPRGEVKTFLATGNLLLPADIADRIGGGFDLAYGLTGGGDRDLAIRSRRAGLRLGWTPDAIVYEAVPPERTRLRWVLRRGFRVANAATRMDLASQSTNRRGQISVALKIGLSAMVRLLLALARRRPGPAVAELKRAAKACGAFAATLGIGYAEYSREG